MSHVSLTVHDSCTGALLGTFVPDDADGFRSRYAEECPNPEGHIRAGDLIDAENLISMGILPDVTIYVLEH